LLLRSKESCPCASIRQIGVRIGEDGDGTGEGDGAVLHRLAKGFEGITSELGQFVEEEDTEVGEAHFSRMGDAAATDEAGLGDRVIGRAQGTADE
jgi:hypothetical protein